METVKSATLNGQAWDLPLDSLQQSIGWSGGFVSTITVVYQGVTFIQTFTNDGTNIIAISQWIPQP